MLADDEKCSDVDLQEKPNLCAKREIVKQRRFWRYITRGCHRTSLQLKKYTPLKRNSVVAAFGEASY